MASAGPNFAGTGANDAAIGTVAWSNPTNITASDNSSAAAISTANETTNWLTATNFGFSIPTGATIEGIVFEFERNASTLTGARHVNDSLIQSIKSGTIGGSDRSDSVTDWPTATDVFYSYGGASDLWGQTWTPADINASNFGVALSISITSDGAGVRGFVDSVRCTVYYSESTFNAFLIAGD